jgi:hypothetical protein
MLFVAPLCQTERWGFTFTVVVMVVIVSSAFCFLSATVLAHPTVAEVEEMSGLMHFPNDVNFVLDRLPYVCSSTRQIDY